MSHGSGEDAAHDPTAESAGTTGTTGQPEPPATTDDGESLAWLRPPAHAAPDSEAEDVPPRDADPDEQPEVELDAGLAIATEPEQFPPAAPVPAQAMTQAPSAAPAAEPVRYPIPPQGYGVPAYEPPAAPPRYEQNPPPSYPAPGYGQSGYETPTYQAPSGYQVPSYEPSGYQAPTYPPPSYEQPSYEQPSYEQPSYEQPSYEQLSYEQPNYAPPGYEASGYPAPAQPQQQPAQQSPAQQPPGQQPPGQPRHADPGPAQPNQPPQPTQAPPGHATPPPVPPPIPRPEDLLVPNRSPVTTEPASWGWRGKLNRGTGGLFKPKAAPEEVQARQAIVDIQRSFSRPKTVVVIQPKGGAGKTPTAICLSAAFGAHRGGYVVGWDDNETRGTLAVRVANPDDQRATVWDLLSELTAFERSDARVGDLSYYVRAQPDSHFDALVSDDNPANMAQIGEDEFQRLHKVLQRFYRMIVVDTGNNVRSPNWQAAVNAADLVVVTSTYRRDVGYSGSWVLDHLAQTGREELARNAVTVLSAADPTTDKTVREQLLPHFAARTRAVAEIPYDPELAHGGPIRWSALAEATRNAWIAAGATIVNALVEQDQRELAARRS